MAAGTNMTAAAPAGEKPQTGSGGGPAPAPAASVVPFVRGSGKGKYKFFSASKTLTSATQDLGPIDIKA